MKRLVLGSKVLGSILLGSAVLAMIACGGSTTPEKDAIIDIDAKADVGTDVPKDVGADTPLDRHEDIPDTPETIEDTEIAELDIKADDLTPDEDLVEVKDDTSEMIEPDADIDVDTEVTDETTEPDVEECPEDDLECTVVYQDPDEGCKTVLLMGWCLIDGVCYQDGEVDPENDCMACNPSWAIEEFVIRAGEECNDPTPCSTGGICTLDGQCVTAEPICKPALQCVRGRCVNGVCQYSNLPKDSECQGYNKCYNIHRCDGRGICEGVSPKWCPDDNNPCTTDACDPISGECLYIPRTGTCDDKDPCTDNDRCENGVCIGDLKDCSDGDPCTLDLCEQGVCRNVPHFGLCDDGNKCTKNTVCDSAGQCVGEAVLCNDNNVCTNDSCLPEVGCVFTPNNNSCNDQDPCTENDRCVEGVCVGTPKDCDDGDSCTRDVCESGMCRHFAEPNGTPCDDGNECTLVDKCQSGRCVGSSWWDCDDSDPCTIDECVDGIGCQYTPYVCENDNPCTTVHCESGVGCVYTPKPGPCDDNDACTVNDRCEEGECIGDPKDCGDGDPCTLDLCSNGVCSNPPNHGECFDGNHCLQGKTCVNGQCVGGTPVNCEDYNECTADSCEPSVGCVHTPLSGKICDDHSVCTLGDSCNDKGVCTGFPIICDDGNYCSDNLCDPISGCFYRPNTLMCEDYNRCTFNDQCSNFECHGISYFTDPISKAATLEFLKGPARPGTALDIDENPATCSPKIQMDPDRNCEGGVDNAFAALALLIDNQFGPQLLTAVNSGTLALFFEHEQPGPGAGPYELNLFFGQKAMPLSCDPTTAGCNYDVFGETVIGECAPRYTFNNAKIANGKLTAGGKQHEAVFYLMIGTYKLPVVLKWAKIEADVSMSGGKITGGTGILGGALDKRSLLAALNRVPSNQFYPYIKDNVRNHINSFLVPDMDVEGTSHLDYASIAMKFTIVSGHAVGRAD